jgi:antitoxin (DNA-binding transcriptional repressor) of toxin-antitoxin stability system
MLRALAAVAVLAAAGPVPPDPCRSARAPLPPGAPLPAAHRAALEDYRAAWLRTCGTAGRAVELDALLEDAEALVDDVSTSPTLGALAAAVPPGAEWPLPAMRLDEEGRLRVDWATFGAAAGRGTAEDARFWRAAAVATGGDGDAAWLGEPAGGEGRRCLRLAETRWRDVADALDAMDRGGSATYRRHARALRADALEALAALARGGEVCACVQGDVLAALQPLAAEAAEKRGSQDRRALGKAAADAMVAVRSGRARVAPLRAAPGAPATGCAP